jgi:hypothetical protein
MNSHLQQVPKGWPMRLNFSLARSVLVFLAFGAPERRSAQAGTWGDIFQSAGKAMGNLLLRCLSLERQVTAVAVTQAAHRG